MFLTQHMIDDVQDRIATQLYVNSLGNLVEQAVFASAEEEEEYMKRLITAYNRKTNTHE